jgi:hypothetical protein
MENYGILIGAFLVLIFIGLIHRKTIAPITKENDKVNDEKKDGKESFGPGEPPHLLRKLGLCPNCPFRDQYQ